MKKQRLLTITCILILGGWGFESVNGQVISNEIHYDNAGADVNERVEVVGITGTNLSGWSLVFYDGSSGTTYATANLSGTLPNNCTVGGQNLGTSVLDVLAVTGFAFQNGGTFPDGWALVNSGSVVEFLSYEGTFTAVNGPASGMISTDIIASESGSGASTGSIQRQSNNTWVTDANNNTFGACNTSQIALPIELKKFTINQTDNGALLTWITASERNNDYFEIERSANGQAFEPIGEVNGAGNSTVEKSYTFTDAQPYSGANYYRLKQVDEDGNFGYSPIRVIHFGKTSQVEVYPNPTTQGFVNLSYTTEKDGILNVEIVDGLGRVYSSQVIDVNNGINLIPVAVDQLPGGAYWLKMVNGNTTFVQPITIR